MYRRKKKKVMTGTKKSANFQNKGHIPPLNRTYSRPVINLFLPSYAAVVVKVCMAVLVTYKWAAYIALHGTKFVCN